MLFSFVTYKLYVEAFEIHLDHVNASQTISSTTSTPVEAHRNLLWCRSYLTFSGCSSLQFVYVLSQPQTHRLVCLFLMVSSISLWLMDAYFETFVFHEHETLAPIFVVFEFLANPAAMSHFMLAMEWRKAIKKNNHTLHYEDS